MLQPNLPSHFELVHDFNISYIVHMKYDRDDGVATVTTVTVPGDRLSLTIDESDTCKRSEFSIQAAINNELKSENTSVASSLSGKSSLSLQNISLVVEHVIVPEFENVSPSLQQEGNVFTIRVNTIIQHNYDNVCLFCFMFRCPLNCYNHNVSQFSPSSLRQEEHSHSM